MRDQKSKTSALRGQQGNKPVWAQRQEEALNDLLGFLQGQEHQADAPLQMDNIVASIDGLMDDDLIEALDQMERQYLYAHQDINHERASRVWPVRELLIKLRDLQKTRLRDAIERFISHGKS